MLPCLLKIMRWGNKKPFSPAVEKRASVYAFLGNPGGIVPSPVSPLVQASAPRAVRGPASATLGKPLIREYLFYPTDVFGCRQGSGLCVAREPRLPRMSQGLTNLPRQSQSPLGSHLAVVNCHFGKGHLLLQESVGSLNSSWRGAVARVLRAGSHENWGGDFRTKIGAHGRGCAPRDLQN
jgi:hypothetical protein